MQGFVKHSSLNANAEPRSSQSSPSPSPTNRNPSISISSASSHDHRKPSIAASNDKQLHPPGGDASSTDSPTPNVTVVPPSPNISESSFPGPETASPAPPRPLSPLINLNDNGDPSHRRLQSLPSASLTLSSPGMDDDGLATPTPAGHTTFANPDVSAQSLSHSRSTGHLREQAKNGAKQSVVHPRSATVADNPMQKHHHTPELQLLSQQAQRQAPHLDTPHQLQARRDRAASAPHPPPTPPTQNGNVVVSNLAESPTGIDQTISDIIPTTHFLTASATVPNVPSSGLLVPDNSDAASVYSVGSTGSTSKKKRSWRRGSNANTAAVPSLPASAAKSPSRKGTAVGGLASALAASGLAMANPGVSITPAELSPAVTNASAASAGRPRGSLDMPKTPPATRSRRTSISQFMSDYSDRDSFHSGPEEQSSSSDDDLDLEADDIPVTGFAVASNRRNLDFHELFPTIPEGDYLIEDYGCALQREILIQGRLYISENHVCFHANIFGWITDLSIPMYDVTALEKRMTAFVIPNAILITTTTAKYTFTSFLSRDTTFDVIYNVWRLARPEGSSVGSLAHSPRESLDTNEAIEEAAVNGVGIGLIGPVGKVINARRTPLKNKVTQCACGKTGQHYPEIAMESILPGTPEKIYNLMFTSGFIKDFMRVDQKLMDIQISDWTPTLENPKLLARNMTYIKPLNGSIGPKQTKCELHDETVYCDFDDYVVMVTTTRTPDVPSGGVFSVKTRTCIMWASSVSTKVIVSTQVEWTGRSFIKGIIEKSVIDGQKTYHVDLEKAMREYIREHQSEFMPEGVDVAAVEETAEAQVAESPKFPTLERPPSEDEVRKSREYERNQRSLQWAYDTFEGAFKVAQQSTEGALELIRDAWDQSSSTTILYFVIVFLVISNVWTLMIMGSREEVGRHKEMRKTEEREKWVQGVVTALWEELLASRGTAGAGAWPPIARVSGDWKEEVSDINSTLDALERGFAAFGRA
ncbi:GRAM domain-containing protein YSP2 [Grifola frondosa]|uniref:GRAM domain-containing protein YSP2 n=1 Tax=Grifola frondosa TaxID=5627 RepID=A0A1C7LUG8_GRIFR|nr:GRAM domain-containing protein YSP2 [Grifola frondosa]